MSRNIDEPTASESDRETAARIVEAIFDGVTPLPDISPSGELERVIGRYSRTPRTALNILSGSNSLLSRPTMTSNQDTEESQPPANDINPSPLFVLPFSHDSSEVIPNSRRNLVRALARQQRRPLRPHFGRLIEHESPILRHIPNNTHADGRQADQENTNPRHSLDEPVSDLPTSVLESQPLTDLDNRRTKRRKLNSAHTESGFSGFNYGRFGQVEPGKLKMEIVSCDGGIFEGTDSQHPAENILENDSTVYCTKSNRCNLILRHQGATVFCLKELCIKAPHSGYTAPVQEGMVFISMTSDDLLARTAQYQIQYSPSPPQQQSQNGDLPRIRYILRPDDGPMTTAQIRARRLFDIGRQDEECDHRTAQIPLDFSPENGPPFNVTTECSDSESEDSNSHPDIRGNSQVNYLLAQSDDDSSDSNEDNENSGLWHDYNTRIRRHRRLLQSLRRRETASNITLFEVAEDSKSATQDTEKFREGGLMAPHARFFIERDKSKCTVRFDPPVSGRFILLKMWSPHHDASGNIDIQSVVATGFAGPRYFPAMNLC